MFSTKELNFIRKNDKNRNGFWKKKKKTKYIFLACNRKRHFRVETAEWKWEFVYEGWWFFFFGHTIVCECCFIFSFAIFIFATRKPVLWFVSLFYYYWSLALSVFFFFAGLFILFIYSYTDLFITEKLNFHYFCKSIFFYTFGHCKNEHFAVHISKKKKLSHNCLVQFIFVLFFFLL